MNSQILTSLQIKHLTVATKDGTAVANTPTQHWELETVIYIESVARKARNLMEGGMLSFEMNKRNSVS